MTINIEPLDMIINIVPLDITTHKTSLTGSKYHIFILKISEDGGTRMDGTI